MTALRIAVPNQYGIDADFWVITHMDLDFMRKTAQVEIGGWSSKAKFTAGFKPLARIPFNFSGEAWPFGDGGGGLMRMAYDKIKTLPPFTLATEEV